MQTYKKRIFNKDWNIIQLSITMWAFKEQSKFGKAEVLLFVLF
jgi:hypothetical protein